MKSSVQIPGRLAVLDGWRGVSILLVLATHLLPLGPKNWGLNEMAGPMGMALFFTLSGFLMTRFLLDRASISDFLIRRFFRVVPLAWVAMAISFPLVGTVADDYLPNFFFYANLPPQHLTAIASHFWSLCVEMQFYVGIALVVSLLGRRGLYLLPLICVAVTAYRISSGAIVDIVTWRRIDDILAGAILALICAGNLGSTAARVIARTNAYVLLVLLALSSHPSTGFLNYLRPYIAAILVGTTLFTPPPRLQAILCSRALRYIATISFAVYVIHHLLIFSWLASGDKWIKYLKRPLLFAATIGLAHASTFYFEQRWIDWGKRLSAMLRASGTRDVAREIK
ncbi:MAG: acyltransferase [Herminiimonas sp.]|nr:acyltransferase [Herminiimonas sp.]